MNDQDVTAVLERVIGPLEDEMGSWDDVLRRAAEPRPDDWDDVLHPAEAERPPRGWTFPRWRIVALAAVILVGGLLVTPALGIGSRLLDLIQSPPGRPEVQAPVWSPGGRRIAFLSRRPRRGEGNFDLSVVNADGSGQRTLAHGATRATALFWSPDGLTMAFEGLRDGHIGLYVVNADGSGQRSLARDVEAPAWSPNGRRIAFSNRSGISVMDATERRILTPLSAGRGTSLVWSPDGRKLAFLSDGHCGQFCYDLYVVNSDGSGLRNLTRKLATGRGPGAGPASDPAWSPDGRRIAFVRLSAGFEAPIYVVNVDGSGLRNLTPTESIVRTTMGFVGASAAPAWSPDGRKIAFVSKRDGNPEVYVMNANGRGERNLTRNRTFDADPAWSPDGRKIAFASNRDGRYEVYVMNADGSGQRRLTHGGS